MHKECQFPCRSPPEKPVSAGRSPLAYSLGSFSRLTTFIPFEDAFKVILGCIGLIFQPFHNRFRHAPRVD
jgi:hypothetical protein